ncbi:hypothetical protein J6590_078251 [Homalodisca vitripennis]|nr:hypothetical protein J6590_078251 [Homalodisca vitripennis]
MYFHVFIVQHLVPREFISRPVSIWEVVWVRSDAFGSVRMRSAVVGTNKLFSTLTASRSSATPRRTDMLKKEKPMMSVAAIIQSAAHHWGRGTGYSSTVCAAARTCVVVPSLIVRQLHLSAEVEITLWIISRQLVMWTLFREFRILTYYQQSACSSSVL